MFGCFLVLILIVVIDARVDDRILQGLALLRREFAVTVFGVDAHDLAAGGRGEHLLHRLRLLDRGALAGLAALDSAHRAFDVADLIFRTAKRARRHAGSAETRVFYTQAASVGHAAATGKAAVGLRIGEHVH